MAFNRQECFPKKHDGTVSQPRIIQLDISTGDKEAVDRALVQCLRLFAQHGRKIRLQVSISGKDALITTASRMPEILAVSRTYEQE